MYLSSKNKYYLIEANRSPQFRAFSEIVGIDVANEIIQYIEIIFRNKSHLNNFLQK